MGNRHTIMLENKTNEVIDIVELRGLIPRMTVEAGGRTEIKPKKYDGGGGLLPLLMIFCGERLLRSPKGDFLLPGEKFFSPSFKTVTIDQHQVSTEVVNYKVKFQPRDGSGGVDPPLEFSRDPVLDQDNGWSVQFINGSAKLTRKEGVTDTGFGIGALNFMDGGRCHAKMGKSTPVQERDLRDIETDELRKQVQELQQQLQQKQPVEHESSHQDFEGESSEDGGEDFNPFYRAPDQSSSSEEKFSHHRARKNYELQRESLNVKLRNFQQHDLSVEEYTMEFEHVMIKCDIIEPEEQIIAPYLGGFRTEIVRVVQLQPDWTYNDVKLAIKVERHGKDGRGKNQQPLLMDVISNQGSGLESKPVQALKPTPKGEKTTESNHPSSSHTNSHKCFKCQGYGHMASDCPNRKIITLVEENDEHDSRDGQTELDNEITYADEGVLLMISRSLSTVHDGDEAGKKFDHEECSKILMAANMETEIDWSKPPIYDETKEDDDSEELKLLTTRNSPQLHISSLTVNSKKQKVDDWDWLDESVLKQRTKIFETYGVIRGTECSFVMDSGSGVTMTLDPSKLFATNIVDDPETYIIALKLPRWWRKFVSLMNCAPPKVEWYSPLFPPGMEEIVSVAETMAEVDDEKLKKLETNIKPLLRQPNSLLGRSS
ncbi:hypothetical protein RHSIM_RhsimUnG0177700 [Rhododendron simsii]|uniref:CCHC-type domain-containing protein n=1 Tax=Rhododendron simsii TaxID=118357 RepID=A0A834L3U1_RHOSS|nr:hypothetical protein RHSIM_RhsimUnG0177700 [Rhododendron simsii]